MLGTIATTIAAPLVEKGAARLADFVITLTLAGFAREPIVATVRDMEGKGATPDEITDALIAWRKKSEDEAQAEIDLQRKGGVSGAAGGPTANT